MQNGFAWLVILVWILLIGLGGAGGYFYTLKSIDDYQSCANFPLSDNLLMYPGQCMTPDGRIFFEPLYDEEQKRLDDQFKALESPLPSPSAETANWKTYKNSDYNFELKYPLSFVESEINPTGVQSLVQVAGFKIGEKNFLNINVFKDLFDKYKLVDQPGGSIYRFDTKNKKWIYDKNWGADDLVPKKIEGTVESYLYETGDGICGSEFIVIPHPSYSFAVEIHNITCYVEDGMGDYKPNPIKVGPLQIVKDFKFLK